MIDEPITDSISLSNAPPEQCCKAMLNARAISALTFYINAFIRVGLFVVDCCHIKKEQNGSK